MPTAYVRAPITSTAYLPHHNGQGNCNNGNQAFDCVQAGAQWVQVKFYVTSVIKSVRFTQTNNCAPASGCTQSHKNAVKVDMYGGSNASGCYFGWVLYGHLHWPIGNGVWNLGGTNYSNGVRVGYVVDYVQNQCSYYNDDNHVHMEASNGTRLVQWWDSLTQGQTSVYSFQTNCPY